MVALGLVGAACGADTSEDAKFRPCTGSTPVNGDSGLEQCAEGIVHRVAPASCSSTLPRPEACQPTITEPAAQCTLDSECTDSPHGHCGVYDQIVDCRCQYGCVSDSDCGAGQVCSCGTPVGRCIQATCATNADCGPGLCVATRFEKCDWGGGFACQRASDQCTVDADCGSGELCALTDAGRRCFQNDCPVPGRPFLVAEAARVAPVVERMDWSAPLEPSLCDLSPKQRAALADYWQRAGQMEHASIAAFARFALQLSGLGAPPELLMETSAAMADETRHAQACFALASAYAGRGVGPGPLDLTDALVTAEVSDVVRLTFREGCVGETAAAHEARRMVEVSPDPLVRRVLESIAADEERHALTAWKFVAWALTRFGGAAADAIAVELDALRAEASDAPELRELAASGVPSEAERLALRSEAVRSVVLPCARALLASHGAVPVQVPSAADHRDGRAAHA